MEPIVADLIDNLVNSLNMGNHLNVLKNAGTDKTNVMSNLTDDETKISQTETWEPCLLEKPPEDEVICDELTLDENENRAKGFEIEHF